MEVVTLTVGKYVEHRVEASYSRVLRLLNVRLDGRTVFRHCARLPWAIRKAREFRSAGPEVHFYFVEPPGSKDPFTGAVRHDYRLWLDGHPVATLGEYRPMRHAL